MSVLPSLIAALERAAGDCLVLRSGERPHVVAGETRHDVGNTVLSVKAVEALAAQILSPEGQKELADRSSVQEVLGVDMAEGSLIARAERAGEEIYIELRRHRRAPKVAQVEAPVVEPPHAEPSPAPAPHVEPSPAPPATFVVERFEPVADEVPIAGARQPGEPIELPVAGAEPPAPAVMAAPSAPADAPVTAADAPDPEPVAPVPAPMAVPSMAADDSAPAAAVAAAPVPPVDAPVAIQPPVAEPPAPMQAPVPVAGSPAPAAAPAAVAPAPLAEAVAETCATPPAPAIAPAAQVEAAAPAAPAAVPAPAGPAPVPARPRHAAAVSAAARDLTDDLDELIADAAERGATALYLRAGQVPAARIDERLQPLDDDAVVSGATLQEIVASCTTGRDGWTAGEHGEWVREFDLAGLVRCYPFSDHAGEGVVIRLAPRSSATGLQRHVPRQIRRACEAEDGLVVVAAPTPPELLAMVAAVADLAARKRAGYVICLEPGSGLPHPVAGAFVSERKLTGSADQMSATVRRAVQEAPDILVVGSLEAPAAIEEVILSAIAPGRLVILGVVAPAALRAVESLLAGADRDREPHLRRTLAAGLRAAFGYRGLRRLGGGRTAVQDIVLGTPDVRARLERADFAGIEQAQRQGADGMRTLDAALARAVARRQVSLRQAAACAASKSELVQLTRRDARERRALARGSRPEWRQGVLRAI